MSHDSRVDAFVRRAAPFARPILEHFRQLVHATVPDAEETIKWSMPFFTRNGANLCHMAAFKAHCAIGFWHPAVQKLIAAERPSDSGMGQLGRITRREDLPPQRDLVRYLRAAAKLADGKTPARPAASRPRKPEAKVPADLAAALRGDPAADKTFKTFSPSHRREYIAWITEAKRPDTRARRLQTTLEWLREGKPRNWKYA